jgi:hypothetical protein
LREEYEGAPKATITPLGETILSYLSAGWGGGFRGEVLEGWRRDLAEKRLFVQLLATNYIRIVDTK